MLKRLFFHDLLETGPVDSRLMTVRDGLVNMYVLKASTDLVCIDTGWRPNRVRKGFDALHLDIHKVVAVFLTHLHWDHARCIGLYPNAEIFVGEQEDSSFSLGKRKGSRPLIQVRDKQTITVSGLPVHIISTPGHTAGSVSYLVDEKLLFTGDILRLRQGQVLPFFSCFNSDQNFLIQSIRRLAHIKGVECLLTGHTGMTTNLDHAFAKWRGSAAED